MDWEALGGHSLGILSMDKKSVDHRLFKRNYSWGKHSPTRVDRGIVICH